MSGGARAVVWMPGGVRTEVHMRGEDTDVDLPAMPETAARHGWEFVRAAR
jgi:hypothetical protein